GSCLGLRRIQMAACLSNVLQYSVEIRMVFPDPCEWYPRMGGSHLRNLQTHHFPVGQALLSQYPQPLDRLVTRPAFRNQRDRLCRFSAIALLVKLFDEDCHLHDTVSLSARMLCPRRQHSSHGRLAIMRFDDPHQAAVEFLRVRGKKELVWPVCVRVWPEHAGNQKLSLRETLAQHGHEGNRTANAKVTGLFPKELLGTGVSHLGQPRRQGWGIPPICTTARYGDAGSKRWCRIEDAFDGGRGFVRFQRRRQA